MLRVVLDSNALDPVVDRAGAYEALRAAVDDGRLEILFTHVNVDEIAATPDLDRRRRLLLLLIDLGTLVPTGAFALDYSRLNFARLMDDDDVVEAVQSGNIDHTYDALVASTAVYETCAIVTNERRLRNRARDRGVEVMTTADLLDHAGFVPHRLDQQTPP